MTLFRADLHCHSTHSDGTLSPIQLLDIAKENALQGLSITDHDTVDAYPSAFAEASKRGIDLITGVEFSTTCKEKSIHILGYAFDHTHSAIQGLCERHRQRRTHRLKRMIERLNAHGVEVSEEEVYANAGVSSVGRPHIAMVMMEKGYVDSVKEAFHRYLAEGKPCYEPGEPFSTEEALDVIHQAQGKTVLAHPHLIKNSALVKHLLTLDFDGIECYYALFPPQKEQQWLDEARKRKLFPTGGSDFHGTPKPHLYLGCSWTPEESFSMLKEHFDRVCPH